VSLLDDSVDEEMISHLYHKLKITSHLLINVYHFKVNAAVSYRYPHVRLVIYVP
jgi:hypothetical protein